MRIANAFKKVIACFVMTFMALMVHSQADSAVTPIHAQVIPIRHSQSSNSIVYVYDGTYIPGAGITQVRVTFKGGGGSGGSATAAGNYGGTTALLMPNMAIIQGVVGGVGGAIGPMGGSATGEDGSEYSGWLNTYPVLNKAGGAGGVGPGAGGGGLSGGGGGRTGAYAQRQIITVVPGTAYQVRVGVGGASVNGSGKGANGFLLIEW